MARANLPPLPPHLLSTEAPTRYRVAWPRLVRLLVPTVLRQPLQLAWLGVLTAPVARLHRELVAYLFQKRRELSYNSQVMLFERALNDRFDPLLQRIRIRNADTEFAITYWNFRAEQQPDDDFLRNRSEMPPFGYYLRNRAEYAGQSDFTVVAPEYLQPKAVEIHELIRRLKLATKQYTLIFQN
ncbi:hypothetical protein [Hymenobacter sp. B81]|uniref:hypothetical protein n=1 Tax=Hymenobacter sp. B81 TaxID=3344878 RepID=UPI0037DD72CE